MVILEGPVPTLARVEVAPAGVILDTLFEALFAVYRLPLESIAIERGAVPAPREAKRLGTPAGVIFVIVFAVKFAT